jgi:hypothetical protein
MGFKGSGFKGMGFIGQCGPKEILEIDKSK